MTALHSNHVHYIRWNLTDTEFPTFQVNFHFFLLSVPEKCDFEIALMTYISSYEELQLEFRNSFLHRLGWKPLGSDKSVWNINLVPSVSLLCLPWSLEQIPWLRLVTWPPRIWVVEISAGRKGQQGFLLSQWQIYSRPNVLEYPPTLKFWMDRWSRDQPQPGSLFQRLR